CNSADHIPNYTCSRPALSHQRRHSHKTEGDVHVSPPILSDGQCRLPACRDLPFLVLSVPGTFLYAQCPTTDRWTYHDDAFHKESHRQERPMPDVYHLPILRGPWISCR